MSTRIRLRRMGASKRPFYRVVVADQRSPRNGRFIEAIGKYHPLDDPSLIEIDEERALHWLRVGAQPSDQVRNLMTKIGIWEKFTSERPSAEVAPPKYQRVTKERVSKKAASKAKQEEAYSLTGESPLRPFLGPNSVLTTWGERHMRQRKLLLPQKRGQQPKLLRSLRSPRLTNRHPANNHRANPKRLPPKPHPMRRARTSPLRRERATRVHRSRTRRGP